MRKILILLKNEYKSQMDCRNIFYAIKKKDLRKF